jgi:hypothetical protein
LSIFRSLPPIAVHACNANKWSGDSQKKDPTFRLQLARQRRGQSYKACPTTPCNVRLFKWIIGFLNDTHTMTMQIKFWQQHCIEC